MRLKLAIEIGCEDKRWMEMTYRVCKRALHATRHFPHIFVSIFHMVIHLSIETKYKLLVGMVSRLRAELVFRS
jgi:hypothetical protein